VARFAPGVELGYIAAMLHRSRFAPLVVSMILAASACASEPAPAQDESAGTEVGEQTETETEAGTETDTETDTGDETGAVEDPMLEAEDFGCILEWPKVRRFRVTNVLGDLDATLAVAESAEGGTYPVGSLLQLVPMEAMLKRAPGFAPQSNDWEFFSLSVAAEGTEILARGADEVVNAFGGNCFGCHSKAEPQWDLICEQGHGCDPLPLTAEQLEGLQNSDPRCP
jgi:hypothetical protein